MQQKKLSKLVKSNSSVEDPNKVAFRSMTVCYCEKRFPVESLNFSSPMVNFELL